MPLNAGMSPAEARRFAGKIASAEAARKDRELRDQYDEERAEARACGYEFPSFPVWKGEASAKEEAAERYAGLSFSDLDLY